MTDASAFVYAEAGIFSSGLRHSAHAGYVIRIFYKRVFVENDSDLSIPRKVFAPELALHIAPYFDVTVFMFGAYVVVIF